MKTMGIVFAIALAFVGCEKKNDTELANSCVMNGFGSGTCTFTNAATEGTGAKCGKMRVTRPSTGQSSESDVFCSGKVEASSSKKVDFFVTQVREMCSGSDSWTTVCSLDFVPNN